MEEGQREYSDHDRNIDLAILKSLEIYFQKELRDFYRRDINIRQIQGVKVNHEVLVSGTTDIKDFRNIIGGVFDAIVQNFRESGKAPAEVKELQKRLNRVLGEIKLPGGMIGRLKRKVQKKPFEELDEFRQGLKDTVSKPFEVLKDHFQIPEGGDTEDAGVLRQATMKGLEAIPKPHGERALRHL